MFLHGANFSPNREWAEADLALGAGQSSVYRELTERVIVVIVIAVACDSSTDSASCALHAAALVNPTHVVFGEGRGGSKVWSGCPGVRSSTLTSSPARLSANEALGTGHSVSGSG